MIRKSSKNAIFKVKVVSELSLGNFDENGHLKINQFYKGR